MNITSWIMACVVFLGTPLLGVDADEPSSGEHRSDSVVRKRFSGQQAKNMQPGQISVTEKKLQQQIDAVFFDSSLREVLDSLSTRLDIQFYVDERALTHIGLDSNVAVHLDLRNVKAELALDLILKQPGLAWFVRNDLVHVTTPEAEENELEIRIYPCQDFLEVRSSYYQGGMGGMGGGGIPVGCGAGMDGGGMSGAGFRHRYRTLEDLVEIIAAVVEPDSWEDSGGAGSIDGLPDGMLVISQIRSVHAEVQKLLQTLRMMRKVKPDAMNTRSGQISVTEQKLQQRIDAVFSGTPLKEALVFVSTRLDVQFYVDEEALEDIGLDSNLAVHSDLRNVKAELALNLMTKQIGLVCLVRNDLVHVTTPEAAEYLLVLRVYPCQDFLERIQRVPRRVQRNQIQPQFRRGGLDTRFLDRNEELESLIEVIKSKISPNSWDDMGGTGVIVKHGEMLVIAQTPSIQREVENLLRGLRTAKKARPGTVIQQQFPLSGFGYSISDDPAGDGNRNPVQPPFGSPSPDPKKPVSPVDPFGKPRATNSSLPGGPFAPK